MSVAEKLFVLLLLLVLAGVYAGAGLLSLRRLGRWITRKPAAKSSPLRRWSARGLMALAAAGIGCGAYAFFIEPYWLEVTEVSITSPKLPPQAGPVRLVHISDLHCDAKVRLEEELVERIAEFRPDLILFTGDAVNSRAGLGNFRRCMTRLAAIAPTYAVEGNWDAHRFGGVQLYGGTGVRLLRGEGVELSLSGAKFHVVGLAIGQAQAADAILGAGPADAFCLVLYHYPDGIETFAAAGADLVCCGHTHGGQVALPFYGALVTLSRFGKRFEAGLYREGDTWMYVSRGIGMEGGPAPRIRFCARPEVTLFEIAPAAGAAAGP